MRNFVADSASHYDFKMDRLMEQLVKVYGWEDTGESRIYVEDCIAGRMHADVDDSGVLVSAIASIGTYHG